MAQLSIFLVTELALTAEGAHSDPHHFLQKLGKDIRSLLGDFAHSMKLYWDGLSQPRARMCILCHVFQ